VVSPTGPASGFIEALHVSGPAGEHTDELMLFGRFVGSWHLEWTGGGQSTTTTGELHFGWVLGGRASRTSGSSRHADSPVRASRRGPSTAPAFGCRCCTAGSPV